MASFSNYAEDKVLDNIFRGTAFSVPNLHIALFTSSAGLETNNAAAQTEVPSTDTGYARVAVPSYTGFTVSSNGQSTNAVALEFPAATLDWGTVTHIGITDAEIGGNVILWGSIRNARPIYSGDIIRFAVGSIIVTLD